MGIRARVQHVCRDNALEEHVGVIHGLHRNDPVGFCRRLNAKKKILPLMPLTAKPTPITRITVSTMAVVLKALMVRQTKCLGPAYS